MSNDVRPDRSRLTRRPVLMTIIALGAVVTLTGANGVFAVFSDRATTGTNSATAPAQPSSADLQISTATHDSGDGSTSCGTFVDDLETGIFTATELVANSSFHAYVCVRNAGSRHLDITTSVIDLVDTDTGCTGDEGSLDTTCGGDQLGELSGVVGVYGSVGSCSDVGTGFVSGNKLDSMASTPVALTSLEPGEHACVHFGIELDAVGDAITTTQSDTVTWKFAFDGTAA